MKRIRGRTLQTRNARLRNHNPLCVHCQAKGRIRPAVEFDHVLPLHKGGVDHESNLQGLCIECHIAKTVTERGQSLKIRTAKGLDWIHANTGGDV